MLEQSSTVDLKQSTINSSLAHESTQFRTMNVDSSIVSDANDSSTAKQNLMFIKEAMNIGEQSLELTNNTNNNQYQSANRVIEQSHNGQVRVELDQSDYTKTWTKSDPKLEKIHSKAVKLNVRKLGDNDWIILEEQRKKAREKQIENNFNQLSNSLSKSQLYSKLKPSAHDLLLEQLDSKIEQRRQKAMKEMKEKTEYYATLHKNISKERLKSYQELLKKNQSEKELKLSEKLAKAENVLQHLEKKTQGKSQKQRDMIQKRILRAKIVSILKNRTPILCENYQSQFGRMKIIKDKFMQFVDARQEFLKSHPQPFLQRNVERKEEMPQLSALKDLTHGEEKPDEVLVKYFTEEELQMIQEDPNYFITDGRYRDMITLFNTASLDEILDCKDNELKLKTYKQKYNEEQLIKKNQMCEQQKKQVLEKYQTRLQKIHTSSISEMDDEDELDIVEYRERQHTQPHSGDYKSTKQINLKLTLENNKKRDQEYRKKMEEEMKEKQKVAEEKREKEKWLTMEKAEQVRMKQNGKQRKIEENRQKMKEDMELMKNYYSKIEQNCMEQQASEIQALMKEAKLKGVKEHLEQWRERMGRRSSPELGRKKVSMMNSVLKYDISKII